MSFYFYSAQDAEQRKIGQDAAQRNSASRCVGKNFNSNSQQRQLHITTSMANTHCFAAGKSVRENQERGTSKKFISLDEVRNMFQPAISKMTIYRYVKEGVLPSYRLKGKIYFTYEDVIQACQTGGQDAK